MTSRCYVLTPTARKHLREAKTWSKTRWGDALTAQYFYDIEKAATYLAENFARNPVRPELSGDSGLGIYPVREHYLIYTPITENKIAIVAIIRQTRDIPALLRKYAYMFKKELNDIKK